MRDHPVRIYYTEALLELLKRKPFPQISISDLVKKSGASRASFYRNYTCKEEIVEEYLADIFCNIFEKHPLDAHNMRNEVLQILSDIYSAREKLSILGKAGLLDSIDHFLYQETLAAIHKLGVWNNRYQPHFFAGATSAMIKAWIKYGFEEAPEQMREIFFRSLSGYMAFD